MICALCHTPFKSGDTLMADAERQAWVHVECPSVYDVDEVRSKCMAQYAAYLDAQLTVAEARQFAEGHTTEGDVIIAHGLGVLL